MPEIPADPPLALDLEQSLERVARAVDRTRAGEDEMFEGDARHYFEVGRSALRCVALALELAGRPAPGRILDLPSGHGRVLRWFRAAWPASELTACDLLPGGVDFCARTFGARAVIAELAPERSALPADHFDLIWVGSLLTHLDLELWNAYARVFSRSLAKGGLLVFTTLGRYAAYRIRQGEGYRLAPSDLPPLLERFEREGFAYAAYPGQRHYGICLASAAWVTARIVADPSWRLVACSERAWDEHQDVVACQRLG